MCFQERSLNLVLCLDTLKRRASAAFAVVLEGLVSEKFDLMAVYAEHGVRFEYPDGWELSHEHDDDDFTVTVESEGTAFWMLSVLSGRPAAEDCGCGRS